MKTLIAYHIDREENFLVGFKVIREESVVAEGSLTWRDNELIERVLNYSTNEWMIMSKLPMPVLTECYDIYKQRIKYLVRVMFGISIGEEFIFIEI